MSSVSSMAYLAPSGNSAGNHGNADKPLPPQGQQGQSLYQSAVRFVRDLFQSQPPMPADLLASFAKAKDLHHRDPGFGLSRASKDQWMPWRESGRQKMAYKIYKEIAPELLLADKKAEAGEAYEATALLELKYYKEDDDEMMDNEKHFEAAHKAYYDVQPLAAARCLEQMIKIKLRQGSLRSAASHAQNLGDLYMTKCDDPEGAITAWRNASSWFKNDRAMALAVGAHKKVAEAYSRKLDYYKAIEAWEWCFDNYPNDRDQRSNQAIGFFFNAGLCHVATGDTVALSRAVQHYVDLDNPFGRTDECRFLFDISKAMEDGDEESFKFLSGSFNDKHAHQLPDWKKTLISEGFNHIKGAADDFS